MKRGGKLTDMDYITLYAKALKKDNSLFNQQKKLIYSQMKISREIFAKRFGKKNFKENARKYLRGVGILK